MMVELYHFWSSVCSVRVRMALEEKQVPWTSRYVDLFKFDQLRPEYLAINPEGVVPTLVHKGEIICDSAVINEYIDAAFGGVPLIPADALKAARMRGFVRACEDGFEAIVKLTMVKYIIPKLRNRWGDEALLEQVTRRPTKFLQDMHSRGVRGEIGEKELAEAGARIEVLLDRLETALVPGPWIVGEFSLADICVAPFMFRLSALGEEQFWSATKRPNIHAWYKTMATRSSFQIATSWPDESGGGYEEVGLAGKIGSQLTGAV
ncbi:glutathione S-transferase family protein [Paraburkholderia sediminicola]|uniref:glutathione S-transferase family protein n=1 Tax=Paraburkholderia sediminicola TaxID=458836 RepID=UPI0038B83324